MKVNPKTVIAKKNSMRKKKKTVTRFKNDFFLSLIHIK